MSQVSRGEKTNALFPICDLSRRQEWETGAVVDGTQCGMQQGHASSPLATVGQGGGTIL
jgi:hypothetical protein